MSIRITSWFFQAVAVLLLLLFGAGGVVMGVRCTMSGTVFLNRGPAHSHVGRTTVRHDRTRLYGPGVLLLALSTIVAAVSLPFVPLTEVRDDMERLRRDMVSEAEVARSLAEFEPVWEALSPREQARLLHVLIDRIDYDGRDETMVITFHASGLKTLADQQFQGDAV